MFSIPLPGGAFGGERPNNSLDFVLVGYYKAAKAFVGSLRNANAQKLGENIL
jgi:hypothetical protein